MKILTCNFFFLDRVFGLRSDFSKMIHSVSQIKLWEMKQIFMIKFKIITCLFVSFNTLSALIKYSKTLLNSINYIKIFREIRIKLHLEKNSFK